MWDELSNGDLLCHLVVKILTVEHHGLQDGQGPLQHCRVHGRFVHIAGDLQEGQSRTHRIIYKVSFLHGNGGQLKKNLLLTCENRDIS